MEILNHALALAGVPQEKIAEITANEAFKGVAIPDEITTQVKNSLTNLERAKAHPDIANHFKGTHFGVIDSATKETLSELGFEQEAIDDIFNGRKTAERLKEAIKRAEAHGSKKAGKSTNAQVEELRTLLKEQEAGLKTTEEQYNSQLTAKEQELNNLRYDYALGDALSGSGLKFMGLPPDVLKVSATHLINSKLAEIKAKAIAVNGKIQLVREDDPMQIHHSGAEATDFYKLLPTWLESIVDKSNATQTGQGATLIGNNIPKSRAEQARMDMLKSLG